MSWGQAEKQRAEGLIASAKLNQDVSSSEITKLDNSYDLYKGIEDLFGIPAVFTAGVHYQEMTSDIGKNLAYLGNGQPWNRKTTIVPKGRGPWSSFLEATADWVRLQGLDKIARGDWSLARCVYEWEVHNGMGYRGRGINTPFVWSYTNHYSTGYYVADGKFDPGKKKSGPGCFALYLALTQKNSRWTVGSAVPTQPKPEVPVTTGFTKEKLAASAEAEAKLGLVWVPGGAARKYTIDFEKAPAGFGTGRFEWCGAFTRYNCLQAGLDIPVKCPSNFGYTFALVEAWQQWAIEKGFYIDNTKGLVPQRGWIVIFDWDQSSEDEGDKDWDNHVGIVRGADSSGILTAEGNTDNNRTALKTRSSKTIQGYINIPDGYSFATGQANPGVPGEPVVTPPTVPQIPRPAFYDDDAFVKYFQARAGISADGVPGAQTYAALDAMFAEFPSKF